MHRAVLRPDAPGTLRARLARFMRTVLLTLVLATGCGGAPVALEQPAGWDDAIALPPVTDEDPDPNVVQVSLEARITSLEVKAGTRSDVWAYNGGLPGPLIRARVGQRLVVRFTNSLPEATTVHWHGVRVPNPMDGSELSQAPVPPGGAFEYRFELRDAGTFWYHSHVNSSAQVGHGLYGMLLVDEAKGPPLGDALPLVFSDMSLAADGSILPGDQDGALGSYFGREGNTLLLNGRVLPHLGARAGVPQRWHLVNASRSRFFLLRVPGATLVRLGGDGGRIAKPEPLDAIFLVPGERMEVQVTFAAASEKHVVQLDDANRFHLPAPQPPEPLFTLEVQAAKPGQPKPPALPAALRSIDALDAGGGLARSLVLGDTSVAGKPVLTINGQPSWELPPLHARLGTTETWTVENTTDFDHPVHLHGYFFQVLDRGGVAFAPEWKDTINLPAKQRLRFAVSFDERPGTWMFHCHILDHVELGMMAMLMVDP